MPGPESQSCSSGRVRRPSRRMNDYDQESGPLTNLPKSVGRMETPPSADAAQDIERARKQARDLIVPGVLRSLPGAPSI
ncbi:hypothetical protein FRC12_019862 [Ceratobasidium sp. 428]|nr:hypothetical protein FRC12_019862 [Ceratobasidium sp. 428]